MRISTITFWRGGCRATIYHYHYHYCYFVSTTIANMIATISTTLTAIHFILLICICIYIYIYILININIALHYLILCNATTFYRSVVILPLPLKGLVTITFSLNGGGDYTPFPVEGWWWQIQISRFPIREIWDPDNQILDQRDLGSGAPDPSMFLVFLVFLVFRTSWIWSSGSQIPLIQNLVIWIPDLSDPESGYLGLPPPSFKGEGGIATTTL